MGPLQGVKFVEFAGIGPGPMCAMLLADMGATVLRIDRSTDADLGIKRPLKHNLLLRNRRTIRIDLKQPQALALALELVERADGLIEGFRPGVMERLGLGPEVCLARNPKLAYGRMTGWGQDGPLAKAAGHDLNYIAVTGALDAIGREGGPPTPPLNLVGDYGGGALYLALGLLAAIMHARSGGRGQVVDAAIVDGTASVMTAIYGLRAAGLWNGGRGGNVTDSGAHFYDVYRCADGRYVSVAPIEGRFHADLLRRLDIAPETIGAQWDTKTWPQAKAVLTARFASRTQAQWCELLEGTDVCFAPVLSMDEAPAHRHLAARGTFVELDGVVQPAPAPRFSGTPNAVPESAERAAAVPARIALTDWLPTTRIEELTSAGIIGP